MALCGSVASGWPPGRDFVASRTNCSPVGARGCDGHGNFGRVGARRVGWRANLAVLVCGGSLAAPDLSPLVVPSRRMGRKQARAKLRGDLGLLAWLILQLGTELLELLVSGGPLGALGVLLLSIPRRLGRKQARAQLWGDLLLAKVILHLGNERPKLLVPRRHATLRSSRSGCKLIARLFAGIFNQPHTRRSLVVVAGGKAGNGNNGGRGGRGCDGTHHGLYASEHATL
mmetsp:Transcript_18037/g.52022  ORF Transcript_18037/g.52022 Transcript_18037/m.52022 type:complete len:229 (+) Transcript_18037:203-889(+)